MTTAPARPTFAAASRDLLRETILDAVGELAGERRWSDVKMADVATRAGVSRQTLYNTFGSRQEMAEAYVMREGARFLTAVESAIRDNAPDGPAALAAALGIFLEAAQTHPLLKAVGTADVGDELVPLITTRGGPLVEAVTRRLTDLLLENWPGVPRSDAALLADCVVRLAISHAALPGGHPDKTSAGLARILGPFINSVVGQARD